MYIQYLRSVFMCKYVNSCSAQNDPFHLHLFHFAGGSKCFRKSEIRVFTNPKLNANITKVNAMSLSATIPNEKPVFILITPPCMQPKAIGLGWRLQRDDYQENAIFS